MKKFFEDKRVGVRVALLGFLGVIAVAIIGGIFSLISVYFEHVLDLEEIRFESDNEAAVIQTELSTQDLKTSHVTSSTPLVSYTAPTVLPTQTTIPPTNTPTLVDTITPTLVALESSEYISNGDCNVNAPPCTYTIRQNDTLGDIAKLMYDDASLSHVIINANRNPDGTKPVLHWRQELFIPSLDAIPPLNFPECDLSNREFPCIYITLENDTVELIAQAFYRNVELADHIETHNRTNWMLIDYYEESFPSGVVLVLPIPPN